MKKFGTVLVLAAILTTYLMQAAGPAPTLWKLAAHSDRVNSVAFSPDGTALASGSSDRLIQFYRVSDGEVLRTFNEEAEPIHESSVENIAFSPNGQWLAAASYQTVQIWSVTNGTLLQTLTNHTDWVLSVGWSPDSKYLASGSFDQKIFLWNTTNWTVRQTFSHNGQVRAVSYSSDNFHLATGAGDSDVRVWHVPDGPLHEILVGHNADVESVAFSPDGTLIASGSQDMTIRIWSMATDQTLRILTGHNDFVYNLAWSPDGKLLASCAGTDHTLKVWRVSDGFLLRNFDEGIGEATTVAFSKDGLLAYGQTDGTLGIVSLTALALSTPQVTNGVAHLRVVGPPAQKVALESSVNATNWIRLQTNTLSSDNIELTQAVNGSTKFFRAVKVP